MGRPTKLTEERQAAICDALRIGVSIKTAMELAGLDESTYYKWRERGERELQRVDEGHANCRVRQGEERYVQFFKATTRAKAESEKWLVEQVRKEAPHDWRAAIEMLQRRFPDRWSKKQIQEHQGNPEKPVQVIFKQPND